MADTKLWVPGKDLKVTDSIASRMSAMDKFAMPGDEGQGDPDLPRDPWQPRWRVDQKWIEFECGCRAERCSRLAVPMRQGDPVIFAGLPEQAVYDFVCHRHGPGMNKYIGLAFAQFKTFDQWKTARRHLLMGKTLHG